VRGLRTSVEALVLYDRPDLRQIFDLEAMRTRRARGLSGRVALDHRIAKVLPAGSQLRVDLSTRNEARGTVRVEDCAYSPYADGDLWVIDDLLVEAAVEEEALRPKAQAWPAWPEMAARLRGALGARYLWGGTSGEGSPAQRDWLLARGLLAPDMLDEDPDLAIVAGARGFDCSGLFCAASEFRYLGDCKDFENFSPRWLLPLPASIRRDAAALVSILAPGDILLYRGHMLVMLTADRVIQAVGEGENAEAFAAVTGTDPRLRYDGVVEDEAAAILTALIEVQGRRFADDWAGYARGDVLILRPQGGGEG
jgi:hypothetical protein